ncbi:MAG: lipocalin family protein [Candidatus Kapaibacterium sp.]
MKNLNLTAAICLALFIASCTGTVSPDPASLGGYWQGEKSFINGEEENSKWAEGVILGLFPTEEGENFYYRVYENGTWVLEGDQLKCFPREGLKLPTTKYTIAELTDNRLILERRNIRAKELERKIDGISPDDIITVREEFRRKEK